nr:granulocyte colony-stimulating factor isoform X1 [Anser cygnoides]
MCSLTRVLVLVLGALLGAPWRALHGAPLAELSGDQDFQLFLHKNLEFTRKIKGDVAALQRVVCDTFQLCKEEELLLVQQDLRITQVALEHCHRPSFQAVSASGHPCHELPGLSLGQPSGGAVRAGNGGSVQALPSAADPPPCRAARRRLASARSATGSTPTTAPSPLSWSCCPRTPAWWRRCSWMRPTSPPTSSSRWRTWAWTR